MSLLLEALKKAEQAKEEARRRAKGEAAGAQDGVSLPGAADKHVVTRAELPDISQPLEIVSEDFAPSGSAARRPAEPSPLAMDLAPEPAARRAPAAERSVPPSERRTERAAAKNLFEAKFKEPNPKLPFYITTGVLGVFAVGTVVYFWMQLRPPATLVNPNPARPANEKAVDVSALATPPVATSARRAAEPAIQIPGLPVGRALPPAVAPETAKPATVASPAPPASAPAVAAPSKPPAAAPRTPRRALPADATRLREQGAVIAAHSEPKVHPKLEQAYAAYQSGDLTAARAAYVDALKDEPANRDALLGMAAVEMRAGRFEAADGHYRRLLRADPRDADAHAGLLALRSEQVDPVQAESRLKGLLVTAPDAHVLNFSLGNQFAQQGRWAEAQQSYFKALSADPEHPDYAYNLAVSLDQLRQPRLALDYYRRALVLAQTRAASFDPALARSRVQALSQAAR